MRELNASPPSRCAFFGGDRRFLYSECMSTPRNRRRAPRMHLGVPGRLWDDVGWQQVWCDDISEEGLGLSVFRSSPKRGARVRVTLLLPEGALDVVGYVVREGAFPARLGVRLERGAAVIDPWGDTSSVAA